MRRRTSGPGTVSPSGRRKFATRIGMETLETRRLLATILVTTTADSGTGSLRNAITLADQAIGSSVISFNISGTGVQTITPLTPLPTITNTLVIDGTTQSGTGTTPLIDLNGTIAGAGANGLAINLPTGSTPVTIRGLAIGNFSGAGIAIAGVGGNAVQESLIGTDATGTVAAPNGIGIAIAGSSNNTVGGISSTFRNVISGNTGDGVQISGSASTQDVVEGNLIGVDVTGTKAIPNSTGVELATGATNDTIGGAVPAARNIISGNTGSGVSVSGSTTSNSSGNVIEGNYVGITASGTSAVANGVGILLSVNASTNTVGGSATADRNVISGNQTANVELSGATNNVLTNNYIGTTADGSTAIGSTQATTAGVLLNTGATTNTVGGVSGGVTNVIAGSTGPGVEIVGNTGGTNTANNMIEGNQIGTTAPGTLAIPNGDGVLLTAGTTGNVIGGTGLLARNIISGNTGPGVSISGTATTGNTVQANYIGLELDGVTALPNTGDGINVDGASKTTIGGTATGAGNTVAYNGGAGVFVNAGTGVDISRNFLYLNTALGIDLAPRGVNPNIATSPGAGPNNLLNYPVISSVTTANGATTVAGTLHAVPNTAYSIELFANTSADSSGNGQGRNFVGTASVTTDATGVAAFSATTTQSVAVGSFVSASVINGAGDTSEFSPDVSNASPTADLGIVIYGTPTTAPAGGFITYTIGIANGGPSAATSVVLTDTLPTGVTFQGSTAASGTTSISGQTFTANIGSLAAGATTTFTITATLPSTAGALTNTASVTTAVNDSNTANNTASVTNSIVAGVSLGVTGSVSPNPATVGKPESFTFVVTNTSTTTAATNAILTVPLPAGASYKSSTSSQGSTAINANATGFGASLGPIQPTSSATVTLVLTPTQAQTLSLVGSVQADQPILQTGNNAVTLAVVANAASTSPTIGSAGPIVTNLTRTGIHGQQAAIVLTFDSALNLQTASDTRNYKLVSAGRDGKFNTKDDVAIPIDSVTYSSFYDTVTLTTRKPLTLNEKLQLTVNGTAPLGVKNVSGSLLDGNSGGTSGTNFVRQFSGVGPGNVTATAAVDSVLASGVVKVRKAKAHHSR